MTLRNAFDNLSTEAALRRIANLLTFARDSLDRIRIIVDGGSLTIYNRNSSNDMGTTATTIPFSAVSWNSQDAREDTRLQMRANADAIRKNRWTY